LLPEVSGFQARLPPLPQSIHRFAARQVGEAAIFTCRLFIYTAQVKIKYIYIIQSYLIFFNIPEFAVDKEFDVHKVDQTNLLFV
jgi:hypothetical protein